METSTSEVFRLGREWFEHCMARSIVYWADFGGSEVTCYTPPGWSRKLPIWPVFRQFTGRENYKPDYQSVEQCFPIDPENYRRAVQWLVLRVKPKHMLRVNFNEIKEVFKWVSVEQQRRIVEILYERYPS